MKNKFKIDILGTEYTVLLKTPEEMKKIDDCCPPGTNCYGLCDCNKKEIYIDSSLKKTPNSFKHVLRHELTHSIFYESGLDSQCDFALCEQLVDWMAIQFPKFLKIFDKVGAI